jgi:putative tryptophan/tyrosine transport system substrate-binding protein
MALICDRHPEVRAKRASKDERPVTRGDRRAVALRGPRFARAPQGDGESESFSAAHDINRRAFITLIGGVAIAWPFAARAQQAIPVIGFLSNASPGPYAARVRAFRQGLSETGYAEGRNVAIEYRWADGQNDRLPEMAADLVRRQVAVIATGGTLPAVVAKAATTSIPIVFTGGGDPVNAGLVASLHRPGGNVTGITGLNVEVAPKRLELLHELIPTATVVALLVNPTNPALAGVTASEVQAAARTLGVQLHVLHAKSERDFDTVFATLVQLRAAGLVIGADALFNNWSEQLAALALRHGVPTIYAYRVFAASGGLMSYGSNLTDLYHPVGVYTGRILKGEKPADLPVQQVTKVELIINLKTAKALGITFPLALLGRADEVIE